MSALVSYRNMIDEATAVLTLPFSAADTAHPISNLKLRGLGQFLMLDTELAEMTIDVDFGDELDFNFVGALGLGMATPEGIGAIIMVLSTSSDGMSYSNVSSTSVSDNAKIFLPGSVFAVIEDGISTRYLRVALTWSKSEPPRLARLWIDTALILKNRVEAGADFGFTDAGQLDKTDGQQYVEFERPRTKRNTFPFRGLTTMEAWGFDEDDNEALDVNSLNGLQFAAGTTGEAIIIPKITETQSRDLWIRRTGVYGHVTSEFSISEDANSSTWSATVNMTEER